MKTTQLGGIIIAVAIGAVGTGSLHAAIRDLGVLTGSGQSIGIGISDSGRTTGICGIDEPGNTGGKAFRTAVNSAINNGAGSGDDLHSTLGTLLGGFGVSMSKAYDIKQSGTNAIEIVGEEYGITELRPFWYYEPPGGTKVARELASSRGAALWVVPAPNGAYASAVVGWASVSGVHNAIYWCVTPSQHWTYNYGNIYFPGTNSYATGTDVNRTVGYYITANGSKAFVVDNGARSFSTPAGTTASEAHAIKTLGTNSWVVGSYVDGSGYTKPILWTYTGNGNSTYVQLGLPSGKTQGRALGVNDGGIIVGSAWSSDASDEVACYWGSTGSVTTLNSFSGDSSWNLRRAYKINSEASNRAIVGVGTHTVSGTPYQRGFVLYNWD